MFFFFFAFSISLNLNFHDMKICYWKMKQNACWNALCRIHAQSAASSNHVLCSYQASFYKDSCAGRNTKLAIVDPPHLKMLVAWLICRFYDINTFWVSELKQACSIWCQSEIWIPDLHICFRLVTWKYNCNEMKKTAKHHLKKKVSNGTQCIYLGTSLI